MTSPAPIVFTPSTHPHHHDQGLWISLLGGTMGLLSLLMLGALVGVAVAGVQISPLFWLALPIGLLWLRREGFFDWLGDLRRMRLLDRTPVAQALAPRCVALLARLLTTLPPARLAALGAEGPVRLVLFWTIAPQGFHITLGTFQRQLGGTGRDLDTLGLPPSFFHSFLVPWSDPVLVPLAPHSALLAERSFGRRFVLASDPLPLATAHERLALQARLEMTGRTLPEPSAPQVSLLTSAAVSIP